ncbi:MAG: hypothetical protein NT040_11725 [Bacteroidetes bacterium]|nr:hypothetical protein [Bacteroidota bacterium]
MKQPNLFFGLYLIFLLLLFAGCRKKNEPTYISEKLKSFAVFQVGSYWIYKNEKTGNLDSIFISEVPHFFFNGNENIPPFVQECSMRYGGTIISGSVVYPENEELVFQNDHSGSCIQFYTPTPGSNGSFSNISTFDSLEINNKYYHEVINTKNRFQFSNGDTLIYTFFIAKSVGIIKLNKKTNDSDTTWSLLRNRSVQ